MPGALVIINAIHSLLQDLSIKPVSFWWLVLALIILLSLLSLFSFTSKLLYEFLIFIPIILLSYYSAILFKDGTWLSITIIALPIIIIVSNNSIYKIINSFLKQ
ncbi:membrane protein [Beggiatoa sp. PS]|nr:membrane protein [Beggiatoa sp. PS]